MILAPVSLFITLVAAQTAKPDAGVILMDKALKATTFTYAKSESGISFMVDFEHKTTATRRVYVSSTPVAALNFQSHLIYTDIWVGDVPPSNDLVEKAMSSVKKIGHFYLFKDSKDRYAIRFGANFDASTLRSEPKTDEAAVKALKDTIYFVDQVGEDAQKDILGK